MHQRFLWERLGYRHRRTGRSERRRLDDRGFRRHGRRFNDGGTPRLAIQHESWVYADDYDNGDGLIYDFPVGTPYSYPHLYAHDPNPPGNDYSDLDLQVSMTSVTVGDGCLRWTAEPFAVALTHDWAMLFEW